MSNKNAKINITRQHFVIIAASVITIVVAILFVRELNLFGFNFPLRETNPELELGQTGDFVGGWANSVALIWIIAVTFLQYFELQNQRREFRMLVAQSEEQARAASQQANSQYQILEQEKRRLFYEQMRHARHEISVILKGIVSIEQVSVISSRNGVQAIENPDAAIKLFIEELVKAKTSDGNIENIADDNTRIKIFEDCHKILYIIKDTSDVAEVTGMQKLHEVVFHDSSSNTLMNACELMVRSFNNVYFYRNTGEELTEGAFRPTFK